MAVRALVRAQDKAGNLVEVMVKAATVAVGLPVAIPITRSMKPNAARALPLALRGERFATPNVKLKRLPR